MKLLENIFDLGRSKNWQQALVFYAITLAIGFIICGIAGAIAGGISCHTNTDCLNKAARNGGLAGLIVAAIYAYAITIYILYTKRLFTSIYALTFLALVILSWFSGLILTLLPATYLTTVNSRKNEKQPTNN